MKKSVALILLIILIIGAGGVFALTRGKKSTAPTTAPLSASPSTTTSEPPVPSPTTPASGDATTNASSIVITYSDNGFSPASATIKAGGTVTVKNTSSRMLEFDSDPHPVHTNDPELNIGSIDAGGSKTITVSKTGTWGYHNHLRSSETGTLIVQ